ncbi:nucleotidyltransferase domain-containing protein [Kitasatospora sp. NBC_01300]|uniref:nucleotidyltransferase domain-containing protein n=1 Tax=Kitasatospora sp. NBC_01300 TaxID=2903574 RepID=UPI002F91A0B1|nr:nucleotidyltransferase domain-containing protein [Kitasatospora sp. NBC_01300]
MNDTCRSAVRLADDIFGADLLFAFVGGSYARGQAKPTSDIDVFTLTRTSDTAAEDAFAHALRDLHHRAGLTFDHCGEIFDRTTLEQLLTFTERCLAANPGVQRSACYLADCPLSVFRKGDVVFKFLADPKIHTVDPHDRLAAYEARAGRYFTTWPMPRIQPHKSTLALPPGAGTERLAALWQARAGTPAWTATPVGTGLGRWFGPELARRTAALPAYPVTAVTGPAAADGTCPLPAATTSVAAALTAQCLAHLHTEPEGPSR